MPPAEQGYYGLPVVYADKNSRSLWLCRTKIQLLTNWPECRQIKMEKDPLAGFTLLK